MGKSEDSERGLVGYGAYDRRAIRLILNLLWQEARRSVAQGNCADPEGQ